MPASAKSGILGWKQWGVNSNPPQALPNKPLMDPITVVVIDQHLLLRGAVCAAIAAEADLRVVGVAADGAEGAQLARQVCPAVVVMDVRLPAGDGLSVITTLCADLPHTHVLVLTGAADERWLIAAVRAGALGYILKDVPREELLQAIRAVGHGQPYLSAKLALDGLHRPHWMSPR